LLLTFEIRQGPWFDFKKEHLGEMPVLDIRRMSRKTKINLLELYEEHLYGKKLSESKLKVLPEEFAEAFTRKAIDAGICEEMNLELKLDVLYKLLSKEPMLTG
jgi:hypothetical protein